MTAPITPRLLKRAQVMTIINCGCTKLHDLINQRRLDVLKDGKTTYITPESVDRYIASLQPKNAA